MNRIQNRENKMETTHGWLINLLAIQVLCLIGMGFRICILAKRNLMLAQAKSPSPSLLRVRKSPRAEISCR